MALCITVTLVYITVQFRASKWEAKKDQTRNLVLAAHSTLEHYAELARDGVMSNEEAQKAAMEAVKIMRYEGDNYFWINDLEPKMIMHPNYPADKKPEWYETNGLVDYADPAGKKLFVEFVKVIKEKGEGFVDYQWTKPGQEELVPKVSYVKLLPEWGWIVGSGVYVDDVEAEMASLTRKILIIGLAVAGLAIVLSLVLARSISRPMSNMAAAALGFSEGNIYQKLNYEGKDEIGQLADAFRQMIIYLQQMAKAADRLAQGKLGQLASRRFHTFRIVTRNRRTVDEHIGRFRQVCCVVTLIDSQPLLVQPPKEVLRDPLIRPSDAAAKPVHQLSKSLHPGAADPHQVSRADACSSYLG